MNPLVPASLSDRLAVIFLIGKTNFSIVSRAQLVRYVRGLFAGFEDQDVPPKVHSYLGLYMKACLGEIYYEQVKPDLERSRFLVHSMKLLSLLSVFDHYIDELSLSRDQRIRIFDDLEIAFLRGERRQSLFPQTARATDIASEMHAELSQLPGADWYFSQCKELLFDGSREEAFGTPSVEVVKKVGSGTLFAVAGILNAHDPKLPLRHIEAYKAFGAALNLVDDVADYEHDRRHGIRTSITAATAPESAMSHAQEQARAMFSTCIENLQGNEIHGYMALASLVRGKWDANLAYQGKPAIESKVVTAAT